MEPWSDLLSNLEPDETESIFLATCDQRLSHPSSANPPPELPRHDSGVSGVAVTEDDTKPLHRSDGASTPPANSATATSIRERPTQDDFNNAVWVSTRQNGIIQYFAPRFADPRRPNAAENARVLHMSGVRSAVVARNTPKACTVVDLSAGSGSFAFSYAAAGVQKVLCWDPNPWSIEGLRRGAVKNGWHTRIHAGDNTNVKIHSKTRVMAFAEPGDRALARIKGLRDLLPPVRHVNCGASPTSHAFREIAAAVLDPKIGGWIQVHETCRMEEVVCRANEIKAEFEIIVEGLDRGRGHLTNAKGTKRKTVMQHVQRIGSDVPGMFHCIVDIRVPPLPI